MANPNLRYIISHVFFPQIENLLFIQSEVFIATQSSLQLFFWVASEILRSLSLIGEADTTFEAIF